GAVSVVVEEQAGGRLEDSRNAVKLAAQLVVAAGKVAARAVVHKAAHKKIEPSVVIVVEPNRAGSPVALENLCAQPGFLADVGKGAVPIVAIKNGPPVGGDEEIGKAVVIVIAHGHAHPERSARHSRFLGD